MILTDVLKKIPESLQVFPLTRRYTKERQQILRELEKTQPELVQSSGLEEKSPFEYTAFLSSLVHIAQKIGPKILEYHLLSDDRSGRIPSLVLGNWQKNVEAAYPGIKTPSGNNSPLDQPRIDFLMGGWRIYNKHKIREFIANNLERLQGQPQLLVTDAIDEGSTLMKLFEVFDEFDIQLDVAVLSHYDPVGAYKDILQGRTVYHGEIVPSRFQDTSAGGTVIRRSDITGLDDPPENAQTYHPARIAPHKQRRGMEILVREQAKHFASTLPIPRVKG